MVHTYIGCKYAECTDNCTKKKKRCSGIKCKDFYPNKIEVKIRKDWFDKLSPIDAIKARKYWHEKYPDLF